MSYCYARILIYCVVFFIKKYEMGGACNKYVGEECRIQGFGGEN
jgi:hypothetical protein